MQRKLSVERAILLDAAWNLRTQEHLTYAALARRLGYSGSVANLNANGQYLIREASNRRGEIVALLEL